MTLDCPLCGPEAHRLHWRRRDLHVVRCGGCGLLRLDPRCAPPAGVVYGDEYYAAWGEAPDSDPVRKIKWAVFDAVRRRAGPPLGRYLDVGCAFGHMLERARACGFDPHGVEPNAAAARLAEKRFPGRVHAGPLESAMWPEGWFAFITAIDVIEHVPDPLGFLRAVRRLLAPGGRAAIVTPDAHSLSARLLAGGWPHVKAEHVWYFDAPHLRALVWRAGLAVERTGWMPKPSSLRYMESVARRYRAGIATWVVARMARYAPAAFAGKTIPVPMGEFIAVLSRGYGRR
jgi:SAM-dependent methyltransferase